MASNLDKNIVKDISTKIISMSLNIDHYNKTNKDIIEEPLFSDFFDYFSKTRNIWIKTIESVLKNIEKETNTIDEDDKSDIAVLVVTDMLNYMYIYNIQYVFKQQLKNVDTSTARKNVEVLLENKIDVVEFTIGNKINTDNIDITLITKIGFRQIITNIETDKAYTVIKPPGHISSILSSKFGGNKSKKLKKYRKTRKSKKYKRSRKSRKLKKF